MNYFTCIVCDKQFTSPDYHNHIVGKYDVWLFDDGEINIYDVIGDYCDPPPVLELNAQNIKQPLNEERIDIMVLLK